MAPTALIVDDDQRFQTFVVLDLQMPRMNGREVMRLLRACTRLSPTSVAQPSKVVVLSGRDESATQEFARRLSADACLTKPLLGAELVATLQHVLTA